MKTTAKVFIWIGMILNFYLVFPIIVGIKALDKLDTAKNKDELTTSAWLTFWFCNIVGGICMLNLKDYDLTSTNTPANTPTNMTTHINTSEVKIKKKQLYGNKDFKRVLFAVLSTLVLSAGLLVFSILHYCWNYTFLVYNIGVFIIVISSSIGFSSKYFSIANAITSSSTSPACTPSIFARICLYKSSVT